MMPAGLPPTSPVRLRVLPGRRLQRSGHFRLAAGGGLISAILRRQSASDSWGPDINVPLTLVEYHPDTTPSRTDSSNLTCRAERFCMNCFLLIARKWASLDTSSCSLGSRRRGGARSASTEAGCRVHVGRRQDSRKGHARNAPLPLPRAFDDENREIDQSLAHETRSHPRVAHPRATARAHIRSRPFPALKEPCALSRQIAIGFSHRRRSPSASNAGTENETERGLHFVELARVRREKGLMAGSRNAPARSTRAAIRAVHFFFALGCFFGTGPAAASRASRSAFSRSRF